VKLSAFALSAVVAVAGLGLWTVTAHAESCTNDIDCKANGTACGTDVCNFEAMTCVSSGSGNPGWCTVSTDCKCAGIGATCVGVYCVGPDGGPLLAPPSTGGSPDSGTSSTPDSGTGSTPDAGSGTSPPPAEAGTGPASSSSSSSSSSGGCAVSAGNSPTSPWPLAGLALAASLVAARRRKRS
jgi:MYXO-CTERM domain-containing protein